MSKAEASVASHLLEAERFATMLGDSMRWRDSFTAIKAEHDKAMRAVLGTTKIEAATRSALTGIGQQVESLATARAALGLDAAAALKAAVDQTSATQKALDATRIDTASRSALTGIGQQVESLATARAALGLDAAAALKAAVDQTSATQKALDAIRIDTSTLSALAGIGRQADSLRALGATLDPGIDRLSKALHSQFHGFTSAIKAYQIDPAMPSHRQLSETMRRLSMKPDLGNVAESAASLIQSVGLSNELASDIQRMARSVKRDDLVADLTSPRDLGPLNHDSALHEVVEPSLKEADISLLIIFVVIAVFPALLAIPIAHMTQALQDLLFMVRVLGKLTQVDDAIPGVLLLDAVIRALRRPRKGS